MDYEFDNYSTEYISYSHLKKKPRLPQIQKNTNNNDNRTEITTIKCVCDNIIIKAARINSNISS